MRTFGPIALLLIAGSIGFTVAAKCGDPQNPLHPVLIGVASTVFSLVSAFFMASIRKHEEIGKMALDEATLESLTRKRRRRVMRLYFRFAFGIVAAIAAI